MWTEWTCEQIATTTQTCVGTTATSSTAYTQDAGGILFGLAIIILLLSIIMTGFVFNNFLPK